MTIASVINPSIKNQMNDRGSVVSQPLAKIATVWAAVGVTSWADFASFLAALYSAILISEWMWKRIIRPILISKGWLKASKDQ